MPLATSQQLTFGANENAYASGRLKRPRGPRLGRANASLPKDLEECALAYYRQYYMPAHSDISSSMSTICWMDALTAWQTAQNESVMVDSAVSSLALATYVLTRRNVTAEKLAWTKYAQALEILQTKIAPDALPRLTPQDIDACLLTVFLMSRYEALSLRFVQELRVSYNKFPVWPHHDGAEPLLKLWAEDHSQVRKSEYVLQARRCLLRSYLLRHRAVPEWARDGSIFGEAGLDLEFDRCWTTIIDMYEDVRLLERQAKPSLSSIECIQREGHDISRALDVWMSQAAKVPTAHHPDWLKAKSLSRKHFRSARVLLYKSYADSLVMCQYYATNLLLLNLIWRSLKLLKPGTSWHAELLGRNPVVKEMLASLADSIPNCLERITVTTDSDMGEGTEITLVQNRAAIRPYLYAGIAWPLTIATSVNCVEEGQRRWFCDELTELGKVLGDGALEHVGSNEWARL
jgi:hypothetical protein